MCVQPHGLDSLMTVRMRPLASIIVPCWNNLRYTRECVRSILRWPSASCELIFIDNGSTDGTAAFLDRLKKQARARVLSNQSNLGFPHAINQGMKAAKGDYLVWLNNDAVVTPGWLDRLIAVAERYPKAGAIGPLVNGDAANLHFPLDYLAAMAALSIRNGPKVLPVRWLLGYCLLLKRRAVERVGLLDSRFGMGLFEDIDYCLRLRRAGYDLLVADDAFVFHHWHRSFRSAGHYQAQLKANHDVFVAKWHWAASGPESLPSRLQDFPQLLVNQRRAHETPLGDSSIF
ncbi:MAG TPA: glycosyltransferase family 2 protein [Elusimicrobiota bacterium]|nr:glycosyltransferase family 2 protein [Elusimicrobiota bacterium]